MPQAQSVPCALARTDGRSHHPSLNFFAPLFCFKTKKWKTSPLGGTEKTRPLRSRKHPTRVTAKRRNLKAKVEKPPRSNREKKPTCKKKPSI
jgi:hypothetical protein